MAQGGINVPNSVFGIGEPMGSGLTIARGLAGAQTAVVQSDYINTQNPAANAYMGSPVFDVALQSRNYRFNSPVFSGTQSDVSIRHFALGFANGKRLGVSFSLNPHTQVSYALRETGSLSESGDFINSYTGSGGINRVNANAAYTLYRDSLNSLSLGLGANYYFGFIERSSITQILSASAFNSRVAENLLLGDFGLQAGLIYRRALTKDITANVGLAYEHAGNVRTSRELTSLRFSGVYLGAASNILDTIVNSIDTGSTFMPDIQRAGISFEFKRRWLFSFSYEQVNWSSLSIFGQNQNLNDYRMFGFGMELWPDYRASNDLFEFMRYRAGVRYGQSHLVDRGSPVNEFGISLGLSIPMLKSGSLTSFNISWELARRELVQSGLTESFSSLNIGLIMTPNKFDRWFFRRKID